MKHRTTILAFWAIFSTMAFLQAPPLLAGEKLQGDYQWESPQDQERYQGALWSPITSPHFSSLTPPVEEKRSDCQRGERAGTFLRVEGGLCAISIWLEQGSGPSLVKISTVEELKKKLLPIDSEAKAVDFVSTITRELVIVPPGKIPEGHILKTDRGYLVQLKSRNQFGCSWHVPFWQIFQISPSGEVKALAFEKTKGSGAQLCVD